MKNSLENFYIILIEPQMGENIGASARAMANFGIDHLRVVNPRDGWPNLKAIEVAAHAIEIIQKCEVYPTLKAAVADLNVLIATSAQIRHLEKNSISSEDLTKQLTEKGLTKQKTGILFGRERTGLTNEELTLCNYFVQIPTTLRFSSLNLSHAVSVIAYELFKASDLKPRADFKDLSSLATQREVQLLFDHLETLLDKANFFKVVEKKASMWRNIRNVYTKANLTAQEVKTLRGMLRALTSKI